MRGWTVSVLRGWHVKANSECEVVDDPLVCTVLQNHAVSTVTTVFLVYAFYTLKRISAIKVQGSITACPRRC